ncbi:MAG: hypothetical protein LBB94_12875 [Clostridiales bacterium]|jgi:hypothetical protein|nr:hypothetical protein [Clostridiales bacterium]
MNETNSNKGTTAADARAGGSESGSRKVIVKNQPEEWISITRAEKALGLPRELILSDIKNGRVPFRLVGSQYRVNLKLVREYLFKTDVKNMEKVEKDAENDHGMRRRARIKPVIL